MASPLDPKVRETLARVIHEDPLWGSNSPEGGGNPPEAQAWNALSRTKKMSVRRRANDIAEMLGKIGAIIVPIRDGGEPLEIDPPELELLAKEEHQRWMRMRGASGWRRGPVRDSAGKTHPSMIPYEELSESEREKDRERVVRLPQLLARAGLGVDRS